MLTIGVDVGGTSIKSALIEVGDAKNPDTYQILKFFSLPTEARKGRDAIVGNIIKSIEQFECLDECGAISVASAGTIDWDSGKVTFATEALPGFTGLELSKVLSEHFKRRVVAINDAVGALVGEGFIGAGKKYDSVMMFTLGTGLGASLLKDKKLDCQSVVDTRLGHICLYEDGRECLCGKKGCAETYVSATALKKYGDDNLYKLFKSNDIIHKNLVANFYKDLTTVMLKSIELYNPDLIIVGGGVIELAEYWWQNFIKEYKQKANTPVACASLGNKAGVLGSVYAVLNGSFKNQ